MIKKRIITIQHAQSIHHTNGMVGSWTDWELTELGRAQAESIGKKLSRELLSGEFDLRDMTIISSDLLRAQQTAAPFAKYMGLEVKLNPLLREENLGEAVGKSIEWANEHHRPTQTFDDRAFDGAESRREFWNRVKTAEEQILEIPARLIMVVSHGVTLSVWQDIWQGREICPYEYKGMAGGVSFFDIDENNNRHMRVNDPSYKNMD